MVFRECPKIIFPGILGRTEAMLTFKITMKPLKLSTVGTITKAFQGINLNKSKKTDYILKGKNRNPEQ